MINSRNLPLYPSDNLPSSYNSRYDSLRNMEMTTIRTELTSSQGLDESSSRIGKLLGLSWHIWLIIAVAFISLILLLIFVYYKCKNKKKMDLSRNNNLSIV